MASIHHTSIDFQLWGLSMCVKWIKVRLVYCLECFVSGFAPHPEETTEIVQWVVAVTVNIVCWFLSRPTCFTVVFGPSSGPAPARVGGL